jgi:hypothetical protein
MHRLKEERSIHVCRKSCLFGRCYVHDRSFMVASTIVLTRVMRISILKVD